METKEANEKVREMEVKKLKAEVENYKNILNEKTQPPVVALFLKHGFSLEKARQIADIVEKDLTISNLQGIIEAQKKPPVSENEEDKSA